MSMYPRKYENPDDMVWEEREEEVEISCPYFVPESMKFNMLETHIDTKTQGPSKTRLLQEIGTLFFQCDSVFLKKTPTRDIIHAVIGKNIFKFELCKSYPFRPPVNVFINGVHYNIIKKKMQPKGVAYLQKYKGTECVCCSSTLCANNWTPAIRIPYIINEIQDNLIIIKKIEMHLVCDELRKKYQCNFAEFEKYLFDGVPHIV